MSAEPVVAPPFKPPPLTDYRPPHPPYLSVAYLDGHVIVIDKPSGLLSVPGKGPGLHDCAEARAVAAFARAFPVHRLDMDTSGLLMFARTKRAQRSLNAQFAARTIEKTYLAEVWGRPESDGGVISLPMKADWPNRPRQWTDPGGKAAATAWEIAERRGATTLLRLRPKTGRSHQLRVHMAASGWPIAGDPLYAAGPALAASSRLALYAVRIGWRCPASGARREAAIDPGA